MYKTISIVIISFLAAAFSLQAQDGKTKNDSTESTIPKPIQIVTQHTIMIEWTANKIHCYDRNTFAEK